MVMMDKIIFGGETYYIVTRHNKDNYKHILFHKPSFLSLLILSLLHLFFFSFAPFFNTQSNNLFSSLAPIIFILYRFLSIISLIISFLFRPFNTHNGLYPIFYIQYSVKYLIERNIFLCMQRTLSNDLLNFV